MVSTTININNNINNVEGNFQVLGFKGVTRQIFVNLVDFPTTPW
jgi:hypothetical protein